MDANIEEAIFDDAKSGEEDLWAPESDDEMGIDRFNTLIQKDLQCVKFHGA
jgi:hypothetical protein